MTETIILIVLCAAILVLLILGFVYFSFLKKKEQNGNANQDTEMIKMEFQSIREQLPHIVGEKVKDEFLNIQDAFHKQENTLKDDFQKIRDQIGETQRVNEKSIRESTDAMRKEMESKLNAITEKVNASLTDGFKENAESMSAIRERLGKIDEAQKHLDALQKDVISLNTVLKGNQSRGRYGEMQLEMLLEKIFPDGRRKGLFETQTKLPDVKDENLKPDAAVIFHSGETVVRLCIDSKFPYEDYETLLNLSDKKEDTTAASLSFKNAVKEKAKQVTKYVGVPGTADYAILFIPSEGIYATIQQEYGDLVAEFSKKGVIFASPTILTALIVIIHANEQELARNKASEEIRTNLNALGAEFVRLTKRWSDLNKRIAGMGKDAAEFNITVEKISNKFTSIKNIEAPNTSERLSSEEESIHLLDED